MFALEVQGLWSASLYLPQLAILYTSELFNFWQMLLINYISSDHQSTNRPDIVPYVAINKIQLVKNII